MTERVWCQNMTVNLQRDDAGRLATFQTSPQAWHRHAVSTVIVFASVPTAFDPHAGHAAGRCAGSWFTGCIDAPLSQPLARLRLEPPSMWLRLARAVSVCPHSVRAMGGASARKTAHVASQSWKVALVRLLSEVGRNFRKVQPPYHSTEAMIRNPPRMDCDRRCPEMRWTDVGIGRRMPVYSKLGLSLSAFV